MSSSSSEFVSTDSDFTSSKSCAMMHSPPEPPKKHNGLDFDIKDLFEAYNIHSEDLNEIYKTTEQHITSEICELLVEREKMFQARSRENAAAIASPNFMIAQSFAEKSRSDNWNGINLTDSVNVADFKDQLPFSSLSATSLLSANGLMSNNPSLHSSGLLASNSVDRFKVPASEVMEKSLFVNLAFKPGVSSWHWEKFVAFESDKSCDDQLERCVDCGAAYTSSSALFYHFRRKTQNGKQVQCKKCVLPINNECAAKAHNRLHFLSAPYVCFICGLRLGSDSRLLQHIDTHGVDCKIQNNIACHCCQLVFISKEHLVKHRDDAHGSVQLQPSAIVSSTASPSPHVYSALLNNGGAPGALGSGGSISSIINNNNNGAAAAACPSKPAITLASSFKLLQSIQDTRSISPVAAVSSADVGSRSNGGGANVGGSSSSSAGSNVGSNTYRQLSKLFESHAKDSQTTPSVSSSSTAGGVATSASNGQSSTPPSTTCHLCQKVLSRRDKLKWHLAICAPRFQVDLYDHLIIAGFSHSVAKNVVLGSNCAVKCRNCNERFTARPSLELHELNCCTPSSSSLLPAQQNAQGALSTEDGRTTPSSTKLNSERGLANQVGSRPSGSLGSVGGSDGGKPNGVTGATAAGGSSPLDRLTCHLCNRTLSRRDKLKRHLVRCCETYKRDVEIALVVAGFTAKDVDKVLNGQNGQNTQVVRKSMVELMTEKMNDSKSEAKKDDSDNQANRDEDVDQPNVSSELETFQPIKYHQSPENIPEPPSFPADISSLPKPAVPLDLAMGAEKEVKGDSSKLALTTHVPSSSDDLNFVLPPQHNSAQSSNPKASSKEAKRNIAANGDLDYSEVSEMLESAWEHKPPAVKRSKFKCEKCDEVFMYKLAFSKHDCSSEMD